MKNYGVEGGPNASFGDNAAGTRTGGDEICGGGGGFGIPPDDGSAVDDDGFVTIQGG